MGGLMSVVALNPGHFIAYVSCRRGLCRKICRGVTSGMSDIASIYEFRIQPGKHAKYPGTLPGATKSHLKSSFEKLVSDDTDFAWKTSKPPNSLRQLLCQEFFSTDGSCSKHRSLLHELTD